MRSSANKRPVGCWWATLIKFTTTVILDTIMSAPSQFPIPQEFLSLIPVQSVLHRAEESSNNVLDSNSEILLPLMIAPLSNNPESLRSNVRRTPAHAPMFNNPLTVRYC